ncbi:DUF411 domain-containing protein [Cupriavidus basilensis]|uniref:DUF411 domain-containing protein n=1 Tax=Cupriavidus basilensis TaxID=68895 RepID=A0ABT6B3F4_9BURK|nr:DUF411 domain-containing protein [Cupriavidus basilensis]MDF3839422.1 DUF411 domain-containing protein [Cupriavidus basilensis]
MQRRRFLRALALGATAAASLRAATSVAAAPLAITVYKSPQCGCCEGWVEHLRTNGFAVTVRNVDDTGVYRARFGIPERFGSCHTGHIAGYAIEGHVPAADVKRLVAARPKAVGLAVPAMPVGSPGMEQGSRKDPFDVLLIRADGGASVFASYNRRSA